MSPQDNLDLIIAKAIKEIEQEAKEGMPSPEDAWKDFETKLQRNKFDDVNKARKLPNFKIALVASAVLVLVFTFQSENVIAFKNEVVRWIEKETGLDTVIVEQENPNIEEGVYTGLTLSEAQEKVLFHIVEPNFLPAGIDETPDVEVEVYEYPWTLVKIKYQGNAQKIITLKLENSPGHGQRNTFIPENNDIKELKVNNWEIILVEQNDALYARWVDNGIRYILTAYKISESEVIKLIESLK